LDQAALDALRPLFINVVIARVPAGLSVVHPRSRCPRCLAPIAWYDNLPVLSWLLLRARCRGCGLPISARYPLVELLVAGLAGLAAWRHGLEGAGPAVALVELTFVSLLVALAFIDLDTWLLPWALTLPLAAVALAAGAAGLTPAGSLGAAALGGALGFGAFLAVHLVGEKVFHREALGFGDVVLLGGIGAYLGPRGLLPVILLSSVQGAVIGIALLLVGKGEPGPDPTATPTSDRAEGAPEATPVPPLASDQPHPAGPALATDEPATTTTPSSTPTSTPTSTADPDPAPAEHPPSLEEDWIPPRHAIPYGPFLALAALEWLLLAGPIVAAVPMLSIFLKG